MNYYIVKYSGPFSFIKPWTAVRDGETFSQQFLTPSIVEGIEKKLFPELLNKQGIHQIKGHRLSYTQLSLQQEVIQTRGWNNTKKGKQYLFDRPKAIINRGVFNNPILYLAFESKDNAERAAAQHICLCRNEDILFPDGQIIKASKDQFEDDEEQFPGYELIFEKSKNSFLVGYHRVTLEPMYGWIKIVGQPVGMS
ncbi:hypothetical protein [Fulvivirga sediminis]|uniref:Uncharacterized protein n=1 Tax=Fulvivirga sediminis TaxID=2803949 RepID=A0A937K071_9BACT|nr:hypothetical protein [Fulvivirga sediminis]MBL3656006.1 hypothetical protein [Fulvivirga sediminis]